VHALAGAVDDRLENYDTAKAGRLLADFVDDLSNWYVRRSRQRFWEGDLDALVTLYECLDVLTRLLAPLVPFITEEVWQQVIRPGNPNAPESVHLADWPTPEESLLDPRLSTQVATARALAEAGRAARKASNLRIRLPLSRALVGLPGGIELAQALLDDVADELNVKSLQSLEAGNEVIDVVVKPNFRELGRRYGKQTQEVAKAILAADPSELAEGLRASGSVQLGEFSVGTDDVLVTEAPRSGWVVESQRGVTIALDTELTPELEAEGTARDVVRVVQQARREAGLEVSDRIALSIVAPAPVADVVRAHQEFIAHETLAVSVALMDALPEGYAGTVGANDEIMVNVVRA
jgi:isoleucyl-tRNA synthetase